MKHKVRQHKHSIATSLNFKALLKSLFSKAFQHKKLCLLAHACNNLVTIQSLLFQTLKQNIKMKSKKKVSFKMQSSLSFQLAVCCQKWHMGDMVWRMKQGKVAHLAMSDQILNLHHDSRNWRNFVFEFLKDTWEGLFSTLYFSFKCDKKNNIYVLKRQ